MLTIMKNVHFTKLVKAGHALKEFNFRRLSYSPLPTYHVDVTDDRANRIVFIMQKAEGNWTISPLNIPPWVAQAEESLKEILEESEQ